MDKLYIKDDIDTSLREKLEFALEYDDNNDLLYYVADPKKLAKQWVLRVYYENIQLVLLSGCFILIGVLLTKLFTKHLDPSDTVIAISLSIVAFIAALIDISKSVSKHVNKKLRDVDYLDLTSSEFEFFKDAVESAYDPKYWPDFFNVPGLFYNKTGVRDRNAIYRLSEYIQDDDRDDLLRAFTETRIKDVQKIIEPYMQNVLEDILFEYPF